MWDSDNIKAINQGQSKVSRSSVLYYRYNNAKCGGTRSNDEEAKVSRSH